MRPLEIELQKLKQALSKNEAPQTTRGIEAYAKATDAMGAVATKRDNSKKMIDQLKKKDILERNRASSMRARAKRKAWIQQLERNVTNVNEVNAALQMEVKALRAEVTKLKTLLLAHKDCPITKAMQKGKSLIFQSRSRLFDSLPHEEIVFLRGVSLSAWKHLVALFRITIPREIET